IKVDIVYVQSSAALVQQITAGSLDICMSTGLVDPLRANQMGAPIAIVRVEVQAPPYALLAKPGIKSLAELKGKVIPLGGPKDLPFSGTVVNVGWANAHKATLQRIMAAHTKSVAWFEDDRNRADAVRILAAASGLKHGDVEKAYDFMRKGRFFEPTGKVSRSRLSNLANAMASLGDLSGAIDVD